MLKKIFSVILLASVITFASQFTVTPKTEAYPVGIVNDWYAFTYSGIEYYIYYVQYNDEIYGGGIQVELKGVRNGKTVDNLKYLFSRDGTYDFLSSVHLDERGYISSDSKASTVFNIVNSSEFKKEANKPIEVWQEEHRKKEEEHRNKERINELTKDIANNPDWHFLYRSRGNCYKNIEQYELAIQDYDKAIQLKPNDGDYYFDRGNVYIELKQYERAIQDYDKAIQLKPNEAFYYVLRGNAYIELKQYEPAIQDYNKAIQLEPNKDFYYRLRGNAYEQLKQYKQAIKDYRRAAELAPDKTMSKIYMERASELSKKK